MIATATTLARAWAATVPRAPSCSKGASSQPATTSSPYMPSPRLAMVMPICAVARYLSWLRGLWRISRMRSTRLSPAAARRSMAARGAPTKANSAATKRPLSSTSPAMMSRGTTTFIGAPAGGRRAGRASGDGAVRRAAVLPLNSSPTSPNTSSRTSSRVTRPTMRPSASVTTACCVRPSRRTVRALSAVVDSTTRTTGRRRSSTSDSLGLPLRDGQRDVLRLQHADDVVAVAAIHRQSRERTLRDLGDDAVEGQVGVDRPRPGRQAP